MNNKENINKDALIPSPLRFRRPIIPNNAAALKKQIRRLLLEPVNCCDIVDEDFCHGLVMGLGAITNNRYHIFQGIGGKWYNISGFR